MRALKSTLLATWSVAAGCGGALRFAVSDAERERDTFNATQTKKFSVHTVSSEILRQSERRLVTVNCALCCPRFHCSVCEEANFCMESRGIKMHEKKKTHRSHTCVVQDLLTSTEYLLFTTLTCSNRSRHNSSTPHQQGNSRLLVKGSCAGSIEPIHGHVLNEPSPTNTTERCTCLCYLVPKRAHCVRCHHAEETQKGTWRWKWLVLTSTGGES